MTAFVAVGVFQVTRRPPPPPDPAAEMAALARRLLPARRPPVFVAPAPQPRAPAGECPEAEPLREEIALRSEELGRVERLDVAFRRGTPNPVAEQRFGAALEPLLAAPAKCPYTLECRGRVCKVQVLVPDELRDHRRCFAATVAPGSGPLRDPVRRSQGGPDAVLRDYLNWTRSGSFGNATPVRDAVTGRTYTRHDLHYNLATDTADPVPPASRPRRLGLGLAPGRHRSWPPLPADRSASCRREVDQLRASLADVLARGDQLLRLEEAFAVNEPNPTLTAEVVDEIAKATGLPRDPFPLLVDCRGMVCSLTPRDPDDPSMDVKWVCREIEGRYGCTIDHDHAGWYPTIEKAARRSAFFGRVDPPRRGQNAQPAYVRIRSVAERGRADAMDVMCRFAERIQASGLVAGCSGRHASNGELRLKIRVPGPDEPERRMEIEHGGDLDGSPLGRCVTDGLHAAASKLEVPETREGLVVHRRLRFPGARDVWDGRSPCGRP